MSKYDERFKKIAPTLGYDPRTTQIFLDEANRFENLEAVTLQDVATLNGIGVPAAQLLFKDGQLPEDLKGTAAIETVLKALEAAAKEVETGKPEKEAAELAKKAAEKKAEEAKAK